MAGIELIAQIADTASTTSAKTMLQIVAAANHRVKVKGWGIFCKGIVTTDAPLKVQLIRQTGAGTSSANTPSKKDPGVDETTQTTARDTFTAEPASDDTILKTVDVHPQSGFSEFFPLGSEIIIPGAGRLGLKILAGVSISVSCFFDFEE